MKTKLSKFLSVFFVILMLFNIVIDIHAGNLIIENENTFSPKQGLVYNTHPSKDVTYQIVSGDISILYDLESYTSTTKGDTREKYEKGYGSWIIDFNNLKSTDKIVFTYNNIGTYKDENIGCICTFTNFEPCAYNASPWISVSKSFYCGYRYYNIDCLTITYEYFYTNTKEIIDIEDSYMTFNSLNPEESVAYLTHNEVDGYVTTETNIQKREVVFQGKTYTEYVGVAPSIGNDNFEDYIGSSTFTRNSVSIPIYGTEHTFLLGHMNNRLKYYNSYDNHSAESMNIWNTPSVAPLNIGYPQEPEKTVNDKTEIAALIGEDITYKVSQQVHTLGVDLLEKYESLVFKDILPEEVDYVEAYMIDTNGRKLENTGTLSFEASTNTVTYEFSSDYLTNTMAYNGETYTLVIKCKINEKAQAGKAFTNEGEILFNDIPIVSNIVTVTPYYKITTEVINGTIDPNIENIPTGEDRTISYAPNDGYYLKSITVDGNPQDIKSFLDDYDFNNINTNHHIKVVYEKIPDKDLTITKIWKDEENKYITRPSSLNIDILQNGSVYKTITLNSSDAKDLNTWQQTNITVPEWDAYGNPYTYTIKEDENNINILMYYQDEAIIYDQENLTVTNTATWIPITFEEYPEYMITIHKEIINKDGVKATSEDFEKIKLDINDTYYFPIVLREMNKSLEKTDTGIKEVYNGYSGNIINGVVTNKGDLVFKGLDYGKYEISEQAAQYFSFIDFEEISSTSGATLSYENGKYYITFSRLTLESENIEVKVTNQIKPDRPYDDTDPKENLFKNILKQ